MHSLNHSGNVNLYMEDEINKMIMKYWGYQMAQYAASFNCPLSMYHTLHIDSEPTCCEANVLEFDAKTLKYIR